VAQDQVQITSVRIQNFRSIVDETFSTNRLNLFVGLNDVGKSNILRALDLFFNGSQATGGFLFSRDFSQHAKVARNKAKEIRVHLTLKPPPSYEASEVYWRKSWRVGGLFEEGTELRHNDKNKTPLKRRSRVPGLLDAIRFEYVPAVKGNDYFGKLLGALHDVLVDTVESKIRTASGGFTSTINESTQRALDEIERKLGIKSSIELPSDLRDLFSRLEFLSKAKIGVSLAQRGDGVKARHIPILLRFIAEQSRASGVRGSPQPQTIWGFEEPENNLEMGKAADLAKEFVDFAKTIQIFATTHSPAFYSLGATSPETNIYLVTADSTSGDTRIKAVTTDDLVGVDEHIGLLPLVAPSFAKAVAERDRTLESLAKLRKDEPTVFVEGKIDERVVKAALKVFAPGVLAKCNVRSETSAGANWVKDMLISWAHGRMKAKALGVCDLDAAGATAKREVHQNSRVVSANHSFLQSNGGNQIAVIQLPKPPHIVSIFQKGLQLPITTEEMFPISVWRHAESQGWLVDREGIVGLNIENFTAVHTTFEGHCRTKGVSNDELLLLTKEVAVQHKETLSKYVCAQSDSSLKGDLSAFEKLARDIEAFFQLP
jgi:hypothetical protein